MSLTTSQMSELTSQETECLHQLKLRITEDELITKSGFGDDDLLLLAMVQGRKCDLEKAFTTLQNYVNVRTVKYPQLFQNLSPPRFAYLFEPSSIPRFTAFLKLPDKKGHRVILERMGFFNPNIHKTQDVIEEIVTSSEQVLRWSNCPRQGMVAVIDGSGLGFKQAKEVTPARLYLLMQICVSSNPCRFKGFHVINNGFLLDTLLTVAKQFMPKKLKQRIFLHGTNYASLHEHIPKEILPQSLGGILTEDEAIDTDFEQGLIDKTDYYEKFGRNW